MSGQSLTIPARGRVTVNLAQSVRVQSSEPLAAVERTSTATKLALNSAVSTSEGQSALVFPNAIVGSGYSSVLSVANVLSLAQDITVTFGTTTATLRLEGNSATRVSIGDLLHLPPATLTMGALRVAAGQGLFGGAGPALIGVLDIENTKGLLTIGARPAATNIVFPHVAQGNGLFTALALANGNSKASVTIEIYHAAGGTPRTATVTLEANQQQARMISEFIPNFTAQVGGYIRVRSDQPIWAWEIYGSTDVMGSGPPL